MASHEFIRRANPDPFLHRLGDAIYVTGAGIGGLFWAAVEDGAARIWAKMHR